MSRLLWSVVLVLAVLPAAAAAAAGPPLPSQASGRAGAVAPSGSERFITRRNGASTLVSAVRRSDGRVLRTGKLPGRWSIPAVTLNGGTTGLSADGRTLLLARPTRSFPPERTRLLVVDAARLRPRLEIPLGGFFTVDAISPDGRWAYLIQYPGEDLLDYRVRALDTTAGRLSPRDVVDPRNPDEQMGGLPVARAMSPDGRWAYTLYTGGTETFIHALDTVGRTAACIDIEALPQVDDLAAVALRVAGGRVLVRAHGEMVATVDRRTFAVTEPGERPAAPAPARAVRRDGGGDGGGLPWPLVVLIAAGLCGAAVVVARVSLPRARPRG